MTDVRLRPEDLARSYARQNSIMKKALREFLRDPNAGAVHDARVAVRRSVVILSLYPKVVRTQESVRLRDRLCKKFMKATNPIRDYDIVIGWLGGVGARTNGMIDAIHEKRVLLLINAKKVAKVLLTKARGGLGSWDSPKKLEKRFRKVTKRLVREIDERLESVLSDPRDISDLHAARIDGKVLRYVLEVAPSSRFSGVLKRLSRLQNRLGEIRDDDVVMEYLRGLEPDNLARELLRRRRIAREKKYQAFVADVGRFRGLLNV